MRCAHRLASFVTILSLLTGIAHAAQHFPALTGRVVDDAHLLSAGTQQQLTTELQAFETKTTDQLVVVTVPSLEGGTIEDYGVALGRHWGIGQKGKNNGVLLIIAPKEHKLRIEVGYGLEGTLTDAAASDIIQTMLVPAMKQGDADKAATDGVHAIEQVLDPQGTYLPDNAAGASNAAQPSSDVAADDPTFDAIFNIVFFGIAALIFIAFSPIAVGLPLYLILMLIGRANPRVKKYLAEKSKWGRIPRFLFQIMMVSVGSGSFSSGSSDSFSSSSSSDDDFGGGGGSFGGGGSSGSY